MLATALCCSRSARVRYTLFAFTTPRLSGSDRNRYAAEDACIMYNTLSCCSDKSGTFCSQPTIPGGVGTPAYGLASWLMYVCKNRSSILRRPAVSGRSMPLLCIGGEFDTRLVGLASVSIAFSSSSWPMSAGDGECTVEEEEEDGGTSKTHDKLPMRVQLPHVGRFSSH